MAGETARFVQGTEILDCSRSERTQCYSFTLEVGSWKALVLIFCVGMGGGGGE